MSIETIEELKSKLDFEFLKYLREHRGYSKPTVAMTAIDGQRKRDFLINTSRNRKCPICAKKGVEHRITGPPPAESLESLFLRAEAAGRLDYERARLGDHADAVDMWLGNRDIERKIKQLDPDWRYKVWTDSWEEINREIYEGRLMEKKQKEYVNIYGKKLIKKR